ncbi:MAG: STAS domain-containing protein [Aquisalimonadaceae bacterium]
MEIPTTNQEPTAVTAAAEPVIVELAGLIDRAEAAQLVRRIEGSLASPEVMIVLDLSAATGIVSIAARVVYNLIRWRGPGSVALVCPAGPVRDALVWLGLTYLVRTFDDRENCLLAMRPAVHQPSGTLDAPEQAHAS